MTIQEHISHAQKSFFLSGNSNSTIYLVKPWQSNPKYAGTWKYDPKLCWNIAIRSKLAFPNLAIQSLITHNNYNHNHKYIVKIIYFHNEFIATSFVYQNYNKCDQYRNIHIHTSIITMKQHGYTIIMLSKSSPTSKLAWYLEKLHSSLSEFVSLVLGL